MRDEGIDSYVPAFKVGAPIANFGVGEVLNSSNPKFKKGDHVYGSLEFATYQVISKDAANGLAVLENKEGLPWTTWVGAAGMPGQTAWWGVEKIAKVKKGDTVFVSGAMGPVGQVRPPLLAYRRATCSPCLGTLQVTIGLAHRLGAKVIASAGSEEKVKFLRETYGVERAFNYKTEDPNKVLGDWAKENGPFTVYVDNVRYFRSPRPHLPAFRSSSPCPPSDSPIFHGQTLTRVPPPADGRPAARGGAGPHREGWSHRRYRSRERLQRQPVRHQERVPRRRQGAEVRGASLPLLPLMRCSLSRPLTT